VIGSSATIVAGRLVASVAGLALVAWLTQALDQAALGRYAVIVTMANIGSLFTDVGQRLYLTRQLPLVRERWPLIRRSLLTVVSVGLVLASAWLIIGAPIEGLRRTLIGAVMMVLLGLTLSCVGGLAGTGRVVWAGLSQQAFRPIAGLLSLGLVAACTTLDADAALLAQLGAVATVAVGAAAGFGLPGDAPREAAVRPSTPWLSASLPLMLMGGLGVLSNQIDILIVRGMDSPEGAGVYFNAAALAFVPSYALQAANAVIMPRVSRAWAEDRLDDVHAVLGQSLRFALVGGVPAIVGVLVAYQLGIGFGWTFAEGVPILGMLMVGQAVHVASGSVGITLLMCGHERLVAGSYAASLALNALVSVTLVPILGPLGAAVGTAVALSAWNLWLVWNLRMRVGVDTSVLRRIIGRPGISGRSPSH